MDAPAVSYEVIIGALYVENVRLRALTEQLAAAVQALQAAQNGHAPVPPSPAPEEAPS